ncbi:MAG: Flp family type IVb pilin [Desulfuromonas sp.]|nr:Flp family type IVb pilin [Desulfuromonas sp.]
MKSSKEMFLHFAREENGATAVEYGVLIALIIAVCIVVIIVLGEKVNKAYDSANSKFKP